MMHPISIISSGNGDPELLNIKSIHALESAGHLVLQTERNPLSAWLQEKHLSYETLDSYYDSGDHFDIMYSRMAEHLLHLSQTGSVCYIVFDALSDQSVDALYQQSPAPGTHICVIPGVSRSALALSSFRPLLSGADFRLVSAASLEQVGYDPDLTLVITELDNAFLADAVKRYLSDYLSDETEVYLSNDAHIKALHLFEIDRQKHYDHRTSLMIAGRNYQDRDRYTLSDLNIIMSSLRDRSGCPWDSIQTHESLRPYLVEEAWECVGAIDENDMDHLADELGDLLLQIVFHASIGADFDEFTLNDVTTAICRKMIRRHPHVFGASHFSTPQEVSDSWEKTKRAESGNDTVGQSLDTVSGSFPSLKYASKMIKKASQTPSFKRDTGTICEDIASQAASLNASQAPLDPENVSRLLFVCAELCQQSGLDAELLLRREADLYKKRYKAIEKTVIEDGKSLESLTFEELCVYWNKVKSMN